MDFLFFTIFKVKKRVTTLLRHKIISPLSHIGFSIKYSGIPKCEMVFFYKCRFCIHRECFWTKKFESSAVGLGFKFLNKICRNNFDSMLVYIAMFTMSRIQSDKEVKCKSQFDKNSCRFNVGQLYDVDIKISYTF